MLATFFRAGGEGWFKVDLQAWCLTVFTPSSSSSSRLSADKNCCNHLLVNFLLTAACTETIFILQFGRIYAWVYVEPGSQGGPDYWRAVPRLPSLQSHWLHFTAQAGGHCLPCTAWSNSRLATSTCLGLCNRAGLAPRLMVGICRIQSFPRISSLPLKPLASCQVIYTSHVNTKIWKLIIGLIWKVWKH